MPFIWSFEWLGTAHPQVKYCLSRLSYTMASTRCQFVPSVTAPRLRTDQPQVKACTSYVRYKVQCLLFRQRLRTAHPQVSIILLSRLPYTMARTGALLYLSQDWGLTNLKSACTSHYSDKVQCLIWSLQWLRTTTLKSVLLVTFIIHIMASTGALLYLRQDWGLTNLKSNMHFTL